MPTGYTYPVANGEVTDLRAFALMCARAMGACVMMRDDPMDKPIPERFEPSPYSKDQLAKARDRLSEIERLSPEECEARAVAWYAEERESRERYLRETNERNERILAMQGRVALWNCKAEGLREFMLQQLGISVETTRYEERHLAELKELTSTEWRERELAKAHHDVAYHAKSWAEEIERTADRNRWLKALRDSLPPEPVEAAA